MPVRVESQAEPIPGYKLIERLGGGGFGEVWKAEAPGGLMKAIKFVYGSVETLDTEGARAEQELKALSRVKTVRHPFILSLERYDIIDGQLLIVMELADRNLWDRFRECRNHGLVGIPRDELLGYMQEVAEALDLMNLQYDLQHLDIKPQNLFLVHNHVKVADFGLVKDLEGIKASVTGGVTPVYAAPETFDGWVSRFSDQYSLAIVYQELLTGQRPFSGNNTRQLIIQHLQGDPNLESLPECDRDLVARALAKNPSDRHPNCLAFVQALRVADKDARQIPLSNFPDLSITPSSSTTLVRADGMGHMAPSDALATTDLAQSGEAGDGDAVTMKAGSAAAGRQEECGDGVLMPAVVLGLGRLGQGALLRLRKELYTRHGNGLDFPHLSLLALDTDPESLHQSSSAGNQLTLDDLLLARLNRPARYIRARDSLPPVEEWLDTKMVHRIPRSLVTTGIRALGRLAFIDHYRTIVARLQRDLERVTAKASLDAAAKRSGLALRSNWPRVYIVTSLAGGTGSGMFLDLAYVIRAVLRSLGYTRQEVVGLFFLPAVDDKAEAALPLANTYAALLELNHFMVSGQPFTARYEARNRALQDKDPPFSRCVLIPLPAGSESASLSSLTGMAGDYLYRELFTSLGRAADAARADPQHGAGNGQPAKTGPGLPPRLRFQSFGLQVLSSPRRGLIRHAAERLCRTLTEKWTAASAEEQLAEIRQHLIHHLQSHQLNPQGMMEQLETACTKELGQDPREMFEQWMAPLDQKGGTLPDPKQVRQVLQQTDHLLGAGGEANALRPGQITNMLRDRAEKVVRRSGPALTSFVLQYLNVPGYRWGAADQALKHVVACFQDWLQHLETQAQELGKQVAEIAERLHKMLLAEGDKPLGGAKSGEHRHSQLANAIRDHLSRYPTLRYQHVLLQRLIGIYVSMRGHLTDQSKELGFFRNRLKDLQQLFPGPENASNAPDPLRPRRSRYQKLLLKGAASFSWAVEQVVQAVTGEEQVRLDHLIQEAVQTQFTGVAQICQMPAERLKQVQTVMIEQAEAFLEQHLPQQDAAELFLKQQADEHTMHNEIQGSYDDAIPALAEQHVTFAREVGLLAVPDTDSGRQLTQTISTLLPAIQAAPTSNKDEFVFYRECMGVELKDLKQFGPVAREAYERSRSLEHFTPHSRLDMQRWKEIL
jgi:hypothetical protein